MLATQDNGFNSQMYEFISRYTLNAMHVALDKSICLNVKVRIYVSYRTWIAVCGRISPSQFQLLWEGIQPQALCSLQIWLRKRLPPAPLSLRSTSESHSWYLGVNRNCLTRYTSTKEWSNCTKKEIKKNKSNAYWIPRQISLNTTVQKFFFFWECWIKVLLSK